MRFLKIIIPLLILSCSTAEKIPIVTTKPVLPVVERYDFVTRDFLTQCESDLNRSAAVIGSDRLISSLSHLNIMDKGGQRYYLLEQDNITRMLKRLASYPYSECLLVDKNGKIVYTMHDGEPLGKKVSSYKETPLYEMFFEGLKGNSVITDVVYVPQLAADYNMFFSQPVKDDEGLLQGVVISAVSIEQLALRLPQYTKIINNGGRYSYHAVKDLILKKDSISEQRAVDIRSEQFNRIREDDGVYVYQPVSYKSIEWIIAVKEKSSMVINQR